MDDRIWTTHFSGNASAPGKVNGFEFSIVADWAEENDFTLVAELLRDAAEGNENFDEPTRNYGWGMPCRMNGAVHFWREGRRQTLCGRDRGWTDVMHVHWYTYRTCRLCETILRRDFAVQYADAIEALDRFRAENEAKEAERFIRATAEVDKSSG